MFGGRGEVSPVFPPLGGPAEETTHNAVVKMDSLVPRPEEEEEENLKGMGFNRLRMHLIAVEFHRLCILLIYFRTLVTPIIDPKRNTVRRFIIAKLI